MRNIINFNHGWAFSKQATTPPVTMPTDWDWINLPHTWNNLDGQDGGNDYYRGVCYYAKAFSRDTLPDAAAYYLELQGANASATVYLNGQELETHHGGYSTWYVSLTAALETENLLVIAVDNRENDTVYPQMADFTFYGGLYRDVNLLCLAQSHFAIDALGGPGLHIRPEIQGTHAQIHFETSLTNFQSGQRLRYRIYEQNGALAAEAFYTDYTATLSLPQVRLWRGTKDPYLYRAEITLFSGDTPLDQVSVRFGCRTISVDPARGFFLNGEPYPLRGVSRHQDRWGRGNALLPEHHRQDIDLICELGATSVRLAHYQHDQYFYDLCDERGLIVWAEIPYISRHMPAGNDNAAQQLQELIAQNAHHPAIAIWGLSNEITIGGESTAIVQNHIRLQELAHQMDPTRLTAVACVSSCAPESRYIQLPDLVAYNHYFGWYGGEAEMTGPWFDRFHAQHPNTPIGCSEYGCEALHWHTATPTQGDYTEEYQACYHESLILQLFSRPYLWCTYVWNMFDFGADARNEGGENGQNHKGLVTFDRSYKKDAFYAYKAWLSTEPFVHICGKRYPERVESPTKVTVYSNQPWVELYANGVKLDRQENLSHFFHFHVPNCGETVLIAKTACCQDRAILHKVASFPTAYRLQENNALLNWFDVTAPAGYFSLHDKICDICRVPAGRAVFASLQAQIEQHARASGFDVPILQQLPDFTLLRFTSLLPVMGINITKDELLAINKKLNQIRK